MLVEDLFEQEEGFPQTWGPQEGLVDFVSGVPLVVATDDASFLGEAAAAQRYDLAGAAFMPHLIAKKSAAVTVTVGLPEVEHEVEDEQPVVDASPVNEAEDSARYLPVTKPTIDVAYVASTSNHSLLDGSDFALDFAALDAQSPSFQPQQQQEQDELDANSPMSAADGASRDEQRKQRNRESAARSRKRTRERMAYLENLVDHLMKKNRRLEIAVQQLSGAAPPQPPMAAAPVYAPGMMMSAPTAVARGPDDMFQLAC